MLVVLVIVIVLEVIVQLILRATLLGTHDCTTTVLGTQVTPSAVPASSSRCSAPAWPGW